MNNIKKYSIIIVGAVIGIIAALLTYFGNPKNMGICIACFTRDTAGALGFHRVETLQHIRVELLGLIFGGFISAVAFKEYKARMGSSSIIRFCLGFCSMIGSLVFLGCTWRAILRLGGGDINALFGIIGLLIGTYIGSLFIKNGFSLGRNYITNRFIGIIPILVALLLLIFSITKLKFSANTALFFSQSGIGSQYAPFLISIVFSIIIGMLCQRTRFCTIGGMRDVIILKDMHLLSGVLAFFTSTLIINIILGQFHLGLENQSVAHTNIFWNIFSMILAGLSFTLAGGCPARQFILASEGDSDAFIFIIGMFTGAAFFHNFSFTNSQNSVSVFGMYATIICFVFCIILGFAMSER